MGWMGGGGFGEGGSGEGGGVEGRERGRRGSTRLHHGGDMRRRLRLFKRRLPLLDDAPRLRTRLPPCQKLRLRRAQLGALLLAYVVLGAVGRVARARRLSLLRDVRRDCRRDSRRDREVSAAIPSRRISRRDLAPARRAARAPTRRPWRAARGIARTGSPSHLPSTRPASCATRPPPASAPRRPTRRRLARSGCYGAPPPVTWRGDEMSRDLAEMCGSARLLRPVPK